MSRPYKIEVRLTEEEKLSWHAQADAAGVSVSELVRQRMKDARLPAVATDEDCAKAERERRLEQAAVGSTGARSAPAVPAPAAPSAVSRWRPFEARDVLSERELAEMELLEKS